MGAISSSFRFGIPAFQGQILIGHQFADYFTSPKNSNPLLSGKSRLFSENTRGWGAVEAFAL
jgi:hypothetical protein